MLETIADYNATIVKFRDLVQKLTDDNELLRKNLEEESSKSIPGLVEALDFKVRIISHFVVKAEIFLNPTL